MMIKNLIFQNKNIRYSIEGEGNVLTILHGYLESIDLFENIAKKLAKKYQVILIDLPGHGKTDNFEQSHSMDFMAEVVFQVLKEENIEKCTLIGHSMGGYVTLSFLNKYPEILNGISLFHSTPFADNEPKKAARDIAIEDIKSGKKIKVCKEHPPKTFANENIEKFVQEIGFAKIIALNTSETGIILALEGMKNRRDYSKLLENTDLPFLFVVGEKDNFIPSNIPNFIKFPQKTSIVKLKDSGHQGFIEEEENSIDAIDKFVSKYISV